MRSHLNVVILFNSLEICSARVNVYEIETAKGIGLSPYALHHCWD